MTGLMEHCDDRGQGALWGKGLWGMVITGVKEHCDERGHGTL